MRSASADSAESALKLLLPDPLQEALDGVAVPKMLCVVLAPLLLLACSPAVPNETTKTATLVETIPDPTCAGLDCPPWPMPLSVEVCLSIDGTYYTAMYRPWGAPWATSGERLVELKGQTIEVVLLGTNIKVVRPRMSSPLIRTRNNGIFRSVGCKRALMRSPTSIVAAKAGDESSRSGAS
jgi:hypothetical protein